MKRRLFVAIPISEEVKKELRYVIDRIDESVISCGRVIPEEDWHITLKFLGEQEEEAIPKIVEAIRFLAETYKNKKKDIHITDVMFDSHRPPHIIWANGSSEDSKILGEMRNAFDKKCEQLGISQKNDLRDFTTHISLVRLFKNPPKDAHIRESIEMIYDIPSLDLIESRLEQKGAEYALLESVSFL